MNFVLLPIHVIGFCTAIGISLGMSTDNFGVNLFHNLFNRYMRENFVFSPISTYTGLSLFLMGARGNTAREIREALRCHFDNAKDRHVTMIYSAFLENHFANIKAASTQFRIANRIYVSQKFSLKHTFQAPVSMHFGSAAKMINFADAVAATREINTWVERQTNDKIQNLLKPDAIHIDTNIMLVNAIYFKGAWLHPFAKSATRKEYFFNSEQDKVLVDMMTTTNMFRYKELNYGTALELRYLDSNLSMLVLRPHKINCAHRLELSLSDLFWTIQVSEMPLQKVEVKFPKLKIEFEMDLKEPLKELGMQTMFTHDADFSALVRKGSLAQKVGQVNHKTILEVDEGAEAIADADIDGANSKPSLAVTLDRPFIYVIYYEETPLFVGHVAKM